MFMPLKKHFILFKKFIHYADVMDFKVVRVCIITWDNVWAPVSKRYLRKKYKDQVERIKSFFNGNTKTIKNRLTKEMETAAAEMQYERAAELRDQLHYIEVTVEKQRIISNDKTPRDLFNFYMDKGWLSIQVFFIRQSRLMKREKRLFPIVDTDVEEMASFIMQFYNRKNNVLPREILVPAGLPAQEISEILGVPVRTPQRGEKRDLLAMAEKTRG